jgi:hypothetical protein
VNKLLGIITVSTVLFNYTESHRFEHSCLSAYSVSTLPTIIHIIKTSSPVLSTQSRLSYNEKPYDGGECVCVCVCARARTLVLAMNTANCASQGQINSSLKNNLKYT